MQTRFQPMNRVVPKTLMLILVSAACLFHSSAAGWVNIRSNMEQVMPLANQGPTIMACAPDKDIVYAWRWQKPPIKSTDGGATWTLCAQTAGSAVPSHGITAVQFDPDNNSTFWECGMYGGTGLCKTTNDGGSFSLFSQSSGHCDGLGIDFTDPLRKTILMCGHEQKQTVYKSTDAGTTWNNIGGSLPGGGFSANVYVVDASTYLVNEAGYTGFNGLHRTTNGGATWTKVSSESVLGFPVKFTNGKLYWPVNNTGLIMSTNNGVTWTKTCSAGNRTTCGGFQGAFTEMPGNKIVTISNGTSKIITSTDDGKTWATVASIPFTVSVAAAGVTYCKSRNCLYVWAEPSAYRYDLGDVSIAGNSISRSTGQKHAIRKIVGTSVSAGMAACGLSGEAYDIRGRIVARSSQGKASINSLKIYTQGGSIARIR
jgi:hypothetical protein